MIIIGVDFHPEFQQIAMVDTETGELQERRLKHPNEAESFYQELVSRSAQVRVGMEASGHGRWFERLMGVLQVKLWIGDAGEIQRKRVRKQKTDRQDAQLILKLVLLSRDGSKKSPHPTQDVVAVRHRFQLRRDLPDDAAAIVVAIAPSHATGYRCAVKIAIRVQGRAAQRIPPVVAVREIVKGGVLPAAVRGSQLEDRTSPISAISVGGTVKIPGRIPNEIAVRSAVPAQTVHQAKGPIFSGGRQLE